MKLVDLYELRKAQGWAVYHRDGDRITPNCFATKVAAWEFAAEYAKSGEKLTTPEFFEKRESK